MEVDKKNIYTRKNFMRFIQWSLKHTIQIIITYKCCLLTASHHEHMESLNIFSVKSI